MTKKLPSLLSDIFIGIPGGLLIFMSMLMFNAVLSMLFPTGPWVMLFILCFTSLVVGMLARLMRPFHGMGTAITAGVIAALIILYLRLASRVGADMGLVFGPAGMIVAFGFCVLGAWGLPRLRRKKK
jgi:hypothetical protein